MKKIIYIICALLCIQSLMNRSVSASGLFNVIITNNIEGNIGETITPQTLDLTFDDENCKFNTSILSIGQNITSWFNIPSDCEYSVSIINFTDSKITCQFEGNIKNTANEDIIPITVNIPYIASPETYYVTYYDNPYTDNITKVINTNANYIINDLSFNIQYDGPYEVSGIVGQDIDPQIVKVEITSGNDEFDLSLQDIDLPIVNGLTPTVNDVDPSGLLITITYTGTPIQESQSQIETTINKEYMLLGLSDRIVPNRADVKFNIIDPNKPTSNENKDTKKEYVPPYTGVE